MRLLRGTVSSGLGDLSVRMTTIPGLLDAYERRIGVRPVPGSLNLVMADEYRVPQGALRLEASDYGGTVSVFLVPCRVQGVPAFIVRTENNEAGVGAHPWTLIEVIAPVHLRTALRLADGDAVSLELGE